MSDAQLENRMRKPIIVAVTLIAAVGVAVVFGTNVFSPRAGSSQEQTPQKGKRTPRAGIPVEVAKARTTTSTADIRAIGSLQSDESVRIAPEIAGRIAAISFKEGETVKQGDVLIKLDDSLLVAEVGDQEARFALAKSNYDRANQLGRTGNITDRARDEATAAFHSARATLELARVRLSKHTIHAPFSGVVGLRAVSVGAYIGIGTSIVNLEKIDMLKVDFSIPEFHLSAVSVGNSIAVEVDAIPNKIFTGEVYAIDPMVDVNGRAVRIRARLTNADLELRPGLFARITIKDPTEQTVVSVPESAIVPRQGEMFVYRVANGKAVEMKVRVGKRDGGFVEVLDGIDANASVVITGQQRLRNGAEVDIVENDDQADG
jgi:membrane fusion protein (multidrug efflux system)